MFLLFVNLCFRNCKKNAKSLKSWFCRFVLRRRLATIDLFARLLFAVDLHSQHGDQLRGLKTREILTRNEKSLSEIEKFLLFSQVSLLRFRNSCVLSVSSNPLHTSKNSKALACQNISLPKNLFAVPDPAPLCSSQTGPPDFSHISCTDWFQRSGIKQDLEMRIINNMFFKEKWSSASQTLSTLQTLPTSASIISACRVASSCCSDCSLCCSSCCEATKTAFVFQKQQRKNIPRGKDVSKQLPRHVISKKQSKKNCWNLLGNLSGTLSGPTCWEPDSEAEWERGTLLRTLSGTLSANLLALLGTRGNPTSRTLSGNPIDTVSGPLSKTEKLCWECYSEPECEHACQELRWEEAYEELVGNPSPGTLYFENMKRTWRDENTSNTSNSSHQKPAWLRPLGVWSAEFTLSSLPFHPLKCRFLLVFPADLAVPWSTSPNASKTPKERFTTPNLRTQFSSLMFCSKRHVQPISSPRKSLGRPLPSHPSASARL